MILIGLTGGIACGKSTVTAELRRRGVTVIDFDILARLVVEPGTEGLAAVVDHFGPEILDNNGCLNRKRLGRIVFSKPGERERLNEILGPLIDQEMEGQLAYYQREQVPVVVLDTALLFESGLDARCDATIVITCDRQTQIDRIVARDGLSREEAEQRIDSQMDPVARASKATWILDNCGPMASIDREIDSVWTKFLNRFLP